MIKDFFALNLNMKYAIPSSAITVIIILKKKHDNVSLNGISSTTVIDTKE